MNRSVLFAQGKWWITTAAWALEPVSPDFRSSSAVSTYFGSLARHPAVMTSGTGSWASGTRRWHSGRWRVNFDLFWLLISIKWPTLWTTSWRTTFRLTPRRAIHRQAGRIRPNHRRASWRTTLRTTRRTIWRRNQSWLTWAAAVAFAG